MKMQISIKLKLPDSFDMSFTNNFVYRPERTSVAGHNENERLWSRTIGPRPHTKDPRRKNAAPTKTTPQYSRNQGSGPKIQVWSAKPKPKPQTEDLKHRCSPKESFRPTILAQSNTKNRSRKS